MVRDIGWLLLLADLICSVVSDCLLTGVKTPCIFMVTGAPVLKNRSEADSLTISFKNGVISIVFSRFYCVFCSG